MAVALSFKDLLVFDLSTRKWEYIGAGLDIVKPRMGHVITLSGGKFYLHGGFTPGLAHCEEKYCLLIKSAFGFRSEERIDSLTVIIFCSC
jgi:hypothetical protein